MKFVGSYNCENSCVILLCALSSGVMRQIWKTEEILIRDQTHNPHFDIFFLNDFGNLLDNAFGLNHSEFPNHCNAIPQPLLLIKINLDLIFFYVVENWDLLCGYILFLWISHNKLEIEKLQGHKIKNKISELLFWNCWEDISHQP